jgi:hypothetical protein
MSCDRFKIKHASFVSVFPSVAGPAVGGFAGRVIGSKFKQPDLGMLLGSVTGGTAGQLMKEKAEDAESAIPPGAPYMLDPTDQDIPLWALQGAHMMQPHMKRGAHEGGVRDVVLGDLGGPIYPLAQGIQNRDISGALKGIASQGAGVLGGGLAGHGAGLLLDKLVGHQVNVPGVNIPLSTLLSGLGATIGSVKGLEYARR